MAQTVRDVMAQNPVTVQRTAPLVDAARRMKEAGIGDVIVTSGGDFLGIVTDRDIVVRGIAEGRDPRTATVGEVCTTPVVTVRPDEPVEQAVQLIRQRSVRRLPVVEGGRPVGIVSIGDLAIELDETSALADISAAEGNS